MLLIFFGILLFSIYFNVVHLRLHEYCHDMAIRINKRKTPEFKDESISRITIQGLEANTTSKFLEYLAFNPTKYSKQIASIAKAGTLYPCILYTIICFFLLLFTKRCILVLTPLTCFIFTIISSVFSYLISYKEKTDEEGNVISQPDRFLVRHPEQFKNIHKDKI